MLGLIVAIIVEIAHHALGKWKHPSGGVCSSVEKTCSMYIRPLGQWFQYNKTWKYCKYQNGIFPNPFQYTETLQVPFINPLIIWCNTTLKYMYSRASRYMASSCTDLDNARFWIGSTFFDKLLQGIPAFLDFKIRDPLYFVIPF